MEPFTGVIFPVLRARVTLPFGSEAAPFYSSSKPHRGVDVAPFPGSTGSPVLAPLAGRVVHVGDHEFAGKEVVLKCATPYAFGATSLEGYVYTVLEGEPFWLRMTHHSRVHVRAGISVGAGEMIAQVGATGRHAAGPHVHVELHVGKHYPGWVLDPLDFFVAAIPGLKSVLHGPGFPGKGV